MQISEVKICLKCVRLSVDLRDLVSGRAYLLRRSEINPNTATTHKRCFNSSEAYLMHGWSWQGR